MTSSFVDKRTTKSDKLVAFDEFLRKEGFNVIQIAFGHITAINRYGKKVYGNYRITKKGVIVATISRTMKNKERNFIIMDKGIYTVKRLMMY